MPQQGSRTRRGRRSWRAAARRRRPAGPPGRQRRWGGDRLRRDQGPGTASDFAQVLESEQVARYRASIENLLVTDFLHFTLFRPEVGRLDATLVETPGRLAAGSYAVSQPALAVLSDVLASFFSARAPAATSAEQLADGLARRATLLRDAIRTLLAPVRRTTRLTTKGRRYAGSGTSTGEPDVGHGAPTTSPTRTRRLLPTRSSSRGSSPGPFDDLDARLAGDPGGRPDPPLGRRAAPGSRPVAGGRRRLADRLAAPPGRYAERDHRGRSVIRVQANPTRSCTSTSTSSLHTTASSGSRRASTTRRDHSWTTSSEPSTRRSSPRSASRSGSLTRTSGCSIRRWAPARSFWPRPRRRSTRSRRSSARARSGRCSRTRCSNTSSVSSCCRRHTRSRISSWRSSLGSTMSRSPRSAPRCTSPTRLATRSRAPTTAAYSRSSSQD